MRFLTFFFFSLCLFFAPRASAQERYRLVFWNVENLFDTYDDSTRNDDDFTPQGQFRWTQKRYRDKLNHLAQTLLSLGEQTGNIMQPPLAIGLAEVENDKVLRDLCRGTILRNCHYDFIHFDSPDRRGIDNALLYRKELFHPFLTQNIFVSDSASHFFTRDILLVEGTVGNNDTLILIVNHFPSKRNADNEHRRKEIAKRLRYVMDTLSAAHPNGVLVVMGDFNSTPQEPVIKKTLVGNDGRYLNLMADSDALGSYKYQGRWSLLDQIIVSRNVADNATPCPFQISSDKGQVFSPSFLLQDDERNMGQKIYRTFLGPKYIGGYSDHLPVYVDLQKRK